MNKQPKYLLYVRNCFKTVFVYRVYDEDIFHCMGEYLYRTMEQIEWIQYFDYSKEREERFKNEYGLNIFDFNSKYGKNANCKI